MKEIQTCIDRIAKMDKLISGSNTGTAKEFAAKIGVCERSLYGHLLVIKHFLGKYEVKITYNTALRSYQYTRRGSLKIAIVWEDLD